MRRLSFSWLTAVAVALPGCLIVEEDPCECANATGGTAGSVGTGGSSGSGGSAGSSGFGMAGEPIDGEWVNVTANLAGMESECGNLTMVSAKPDEDVLIAGVALHGLWASSDGGGEWQPIGTGEGSAEIVNRPTVLVYDPEDANVYWEAGIYNGGGVYKTTDAGETFQQLGDVLHIDLVSVDFTDPERLTLLAGGHESRQTLFRSIDGGETWDNIGANVPSEATPSSYPLVLDAETHLLGCPEYGPGDKGIYRSTDSGESWDYVSDFGGDHAPLVASFGAIYWSSSNAGPLMMSDDQGETWIEVLGGNRVHSVSPIELPNGGLATVSTGNAVVVSTDRGLSWEVVTSPLDFAPAGIVYSEFQQAFFAWHWTCDDPVPDDAIMRFDYALPEP